MSTEVTYRHDDEGTLVSVYESGILTDRYYVHSEDMNGTGEVTR